MVNGVAADHYAVLEDLTQCLDIVRLGVKHKRSMFES